MGLYYYLIYYPVAGKPMGYEAEDVHNVFLLEHPKGVKFHIEEKVKKLNMTSFAKFLIFNKNKYFDDTSGKFYSYYLKKKLKLIF